MKRIILSIVLVIGLMGLSIAQTFQSKLSSGGCAEMALRYDANNLYYHLEDISCPSDGLHITVFNQAGIEVTGEGFTIPDDNQTYWLIPFDGSGPYQCERGIAWCVDCCGCTSGYCTFHFGGGVLYCDGCSGCCMRLYPCDGGMSFRNGGVIVQADYLYSE